MTVNARFQALVWTLTAGVFVADARSPSGIAVNLLYTGIALLGLWSPDARLAVRVAVAGTILSVAGFFLAPSAGGNPVVASFNLAIGTLVLWMTAVVVSRYRQTEAQHEAERRRANENRDLAKLGQLAAVVAHEVRNPLAGIRGAMQVIGRRLPEGSREREISQEAITRIDTLNDIVQNLLQFARPRKLVLSDVSISTLVHETTTLLREDPAAAGIHLDVTAGEDHVTADREQVKLAVLNLLMNSVQAMNGRGTIRVTTRRTHDRIELRIRDEGPGIAPELREHLFEPFFTTKHRGTGLGLATARQVFETHKGTLRLECPPEGGTVAIIELPAGLS